MEVYYVSDRRLGSGHVKYPILVFTSLLRLEAKLREKAYQKRTLMYGEQIVQGNLN